MASNTWTRTTSRMTLVTALALSGASALAAPATGGSSIDAAQTPAQVHEISGEPSVRPVPAAVWVLGGALLVLAGFNSRKRRGS
jgi:hypothetical protein